jgi:hypothetical protein
MANRPVTIEIPDDVYERAQRIAQETAQPLEQVIANRLAETFSVLSALPSDEQAELTAFRLLSDDTLRGVTREQMTRQEKERAVYLGDRNSRGTITPEERREYEQLVERGNRLMLRKAWAAGVLMERGHQVSQQDFAAQGLLSVTIPI